MAESQDYPFLSRNAFDNLVSKYLDCKSVNRQRKTFITREDFDFCIKVLQDPANTIIGNAKDRHIRDLGTPANPIIQHIKVDSNLPVCPDEVLCTLHQGVLKHVGSSKLWDAVSEQYCYIPQSFVKEFVRNCTTCATRRNFPNLVAAKPIISNAFLNRVQVDLIAMTSIPDGDYRYICHVRDHFTRYSWARAITSKQPIEVTIFLFDIFVCFGAP